MLSHHAYKAVVLALYCATVTFSFRCIAYFRSINSEKAIALSFPWQMPPTAWTVGLIALTLAALHPRLRVTWDDISDRPLKIFFMVSAGILTYNYAFHDFNWFLGEWRLADRVSLVAAFFLTAWRPSFILLFSHLLFASYAQFLHPLAAYSSVDKSLVMHGIFFLDALVLAGLAAKALGRDIPRFPTFTKIAVLAALAAHYVNPALAKILVGHHPFDWALNNDVTTILVHTHYKGWLSWVPLPTLQALHEATYVMKVPLQFIAFFIELGALLLVVPRLQRAVAGGLLLLHAGIFAVSGIFFWKWMVQLAFLAAFPLFPDPRGVETPPKVQRRHLGLCAALMVVFMWLLPYPGLGWWDNAFSQRFTFFWEDSSGKRHLLPKDEFTPLEMPMVFQEFFYIMDFPVMDKKIYRKRKDALLSYRLRTREEALAFLEKNSRNYHDPAKTKKFHMALQSFARARHERLGIVPKHILTNDEPVTPRPQAPVAVVVRFEENLSHKPGEHVLVRAHETRFPLEASIAQDNVR